MKYIQFLLLIALLSSCTKEQYFVQRFTLEENQEEVTSFFLLHVKTKQKGSMFEQGEKDVEIFYVANKQKILVYENTFADAALIEGKLSEIESDYVITLLQRGHKDSPDPIVRKLYESGPAVLEEVSLNIDGILLGQESNALE